MTQSIISFEELRNKDVAIVGGKNASLGEMISQLKAKERYLTALRCEIKSSGYLLIKRSTRDIFTNNFNKVCIIYFFIRFLIKQIYTFRG